MKDPLVLVYYSYNRLVEFIKCLENTGTDATSGPIRQVNNSNHQNIRNDSFTPTKPKSEKQIRSPKGKKTAITHEEFKGMYSKQNRVFLAYIKGYDRIFYRI